MTGTRAGTQYTVNAPAPPQQRQNQAPQIRQQNQQIQQQPRLVRINQQPGGGGNVGGGEGHGHDGGGGGGGNGGGGPGPNPQPNNPPRQEPMPNFSLTPGGANHGVLDYSTKTGYYHWSGATAKLEEELYDCTPDGLYQFLKSLKKRAESYGWTNQGGIFWVKTDTLPGTMEKNLLQDYGIYDLKRITEHEIGYINTPTRAAQDDRMLYECIMNSITVEGKAKINIHESQYIIGNPKVPSGLCLFKVLVRESHLDSNATAGMIRTQLTNLDTYIGQIGNDIVKFNAHVQVLLDSLTARGETTNDLLTNLFKAYAACSDQNFVKYIGDKQSEWEDGAELTAKELMAKAAMRYKILKSKMIWEAPSAEEEKLLALEARVDDLKKKLANKRREKEQGEDKASAKKKRKGNSDKPEKEKKPAWMYNKPGEADLTKPREWNGAKWWYCGTETGGKCNPGQYRKHKPSECKGMAKAGKSGKKKGEKKVTIKEAIDDLEGGYES